MIDNVNIGTSLTTVLECPTSKRCVVYTVHFCNNSTESETLDIYLSASGGDDHRILKELAIPAGETFVLSTATKINNINQYKKSKDDQEIMLSAGEKISAKSSSTNIKATTNYSLIADAEYSQILISPSPTPSVTSTPGLDRTSACQCGKDPLNDAFQKSAESKTQGVYPNAGSVFYVKYSDVESPHSKNNGGKTIFKAGDCVYQVDHLTGYERYLYNKVLKITEPVFMTGQTGLESWTEITLQERVSSTADYLYLCDSKDKFDVTVPASPSPTPSVTPTASVTPSVTPSISVSPSITPSVTATPSVTPSATATPSVTPSVTATPSVTPSVTPTVTPSTSVTPSISVTPSVTPSPGSSPSATPSVTPTSSVTPTPSVTPTASTTPSVTPSVTATPSVTPSVTATPSVTPSATPSVTPSVSTISATDTDAEWCKPTTAVFYNIVAFVPNGLQGNGTYDFEIGSIDTLPEARNFPSTKVGHHNHTNALFNLELVRRNKDNNLSTYRMTLKKWPKSNGDLVSISGSSDEDLYISEGEKAANSSYVRFYFEGNGTIVVNFSTASGDNCSKIAHCSECLNKLDDFYILNNEILTSNRIKDSDGQLKVSAGVTTTDSNYQNRVYAGWGTMPAGSSTANNSEYQHRDTTKLEFLSYTVQKDGFHYIDSVDTSFNPNGYPNGEYRENSTPDYVFEELNGKLTFEVYLNGILTQIISSNKSVIFNTRKETKDQDVLLYDGNNKIVGWYVGAGQEIKIKASIQGKTNFFNGATMNLHVNQKNDNYGAACTGDKLDSFDLDSLSTTQAESLGKSLAALKGTLNTYTTYKVHHLGGIDYVRIYAVDVVGGSPWTEFRFRDLFWVRDVANLQIGDQIVDIFFGGNPSPIGGNFRNISGKLISKKGNLCVIEYQLATNNTTENNLIKVRNQRDINSEKDWVMLTKKDCDTNIIVTHTTAPAASPSPTPSVTPSPVSAANSEQIVVYNNPISISANNAGPWSGNRPGFTCRQATYGNGNYPWALTSPSGSFPYWTGPLFRLRCLSNATASTQTWQMDCLGWNYCQGPTYTSTATKAATDNSITFNVGAGTLTINFA